MSGHVPHHDPTYCGQEIFEMETMVVEPEQGATATAAAAEGGYAGEGAQGLMDEAQLSEGNVNQEGDEDLDDDTDTENDEEDQEPGEQDQEERAHVNAAGPQRRQRRRRMRYQFSRWQVGELESVFEETHYPDVLTRRELARVMNVPEQGVQCMFECGDGNRLQTWWWGIQTKSTKREAAECWHPNTTKGNQVWFNNRRAKHRKYQREAMRRHAPPGTEDYIFMMEAEEP